MGIKFHDEESEILTAEQADNFDRQMAGLHSGEFSWDDVLDDAPPSRVRRS